GNYGQNFVTSIKKMAEQRKTLYVVNDQYGRPTWTRTLSEFMYFVTENDIPFGTYHLSNDGSCSWFDFAEEILKDNEKIRIVPISSMQLSQKANRPKYSVMDLSRTKNLGFTIPNWKQALKQLNKKNK
ncbi:sugar nucleotide-binding protein, partial [Enterococcus faecalis]|nr:sugar nucleotide-binding protein [Enterococcus faecalis]